MNRINKIGLIGFGVVGEGIYNVLAKSPSLQAVVKKIGIKDSNKKRNAPSELYTTCIDSILFDTQIDTIVELIDDAEAAYYIVKQSILNKKNVVTANKKMLACHLPELIQLQKLNKVSLLYEAAVCGSIPILRNLEEYYNNDLLQSIIGIVNGSTNYILTQMIEKNLSYDVALKQAQQFGFAESNPSLDVEGFDAQNKLVLLLKHTFGIDVLPEQILRRGITSISSADLQYAKEKNVLIKLIAKAYYNKKGEIVAYVMPQFIAKDNPLFNIQNEYNGILIESTLADQQFLSGKGAGRYPTSSAVLSDISALQYGYTYEYKKSASNMSARLCTDENIEVFVSWKRRANIDTDLFIEVYSQFRSKENNFLNGKINLANAQFFMDSPEFSIIETVSERIQHRTLAPIVIQSTITL